jgi:uncharacterized OsmC-like protein
MTKILCTYTGDGQTTLKHLTSGAQIITDLPADNGGKGRCFSPTDLFTASLAACFLTIMGKMAESKGQDLSSSSVEAEKVMYADPRRVGKIILKVTFPAHIEDKDKQKYLAALRACPVHNSLSNNIELVLESN